MNFRLTPQRKLNLKPESNSQDNSLLWTKDEIAQKLKHFSKEDLEFLLEFDFSQSVLTDDEFALLARILLEDQEVYSKFQYDVGQIKQQFLKPDSDLKRQRPSKVPLHNRDKSEALLEQLEKEMGGEEEMGSHFINPVILIPKGD